jgi:prepilin-type N-terminal cleavage/methylation domain-containing protein
MRSHGFSLVECVVASVLLSGGLLAVAASSRATQQLDLLGHRTAAAAAAAAARFAALRAAPCVAAGGSAVSGPFAEQWSVTAAGALRVVTLNIQFTHDGRRRAVRYDGAVLCVT